MRDNLLYEQKSPFFIAVERIYSFEQPPSLDEPGLEISIDIEHENKVLGFEIPPDRGMVAATSAKNSSAIEIHDVASPRIVGSAEMLQKLLLAEIAQHRNVPAGVRLSDFSQFVKRETHYANPCPAAPRAGQYLALRSCRLAKGPVRIRNSSRSAARAV